MKLTLKEYLFLGFWGLVILAFSGLLYYDFNRDLALGQGKAVGDLTFKYRNAQRKYENQEVWSDLREPAPGRPVKVYNRDAIRTAEGSEAVITLVDKTKIDLDANSMIILNVTGKAVNINYAYGSIQAKRQATAGQKTSEIQIKTKDNKTITIGDSDVKLTQAKGKQLNVTVSRGEAKIKAGEKEQTLKKDEVAVISAKQIEIKPLALKPTAPADDQRFFTATGNAPVDFLWAPVKDNPQLRLELAPDRSFRRITLARTVRGTSARIDVPMGYSYWRISAINNQTKKAEYSIARKIVVFKNFPVRITGPTEGQRIEFTDEKPLVNFSWQANKFASAYRLEIARDRSFAKPDSQSSLNTGIAVRLDEGAYFARVVTDSEFPGAGTAGPLVSFRIIRQAKLPAPVLLQPANGKAISGVFFKSAGVDFIWQKNDAIRKTEIWISQNRNFNNKLSAATAGVSFNLKRDLPLGAHYWQVRGLDAKGRPGTDFSEVFSFEVVRTAALTALEPAAGDRFQLANARNPGLRFAWLRPNYNGHFVLEVADDRDFKKIKARSSTAALATTVRLDKPGTYYWRVKLLAEGNLTLSESPPASFLLLDSLPDPALLFPEDNTTVDISSQKTLTFRWKGSSGADFYRISFYQILQDRKKLLFQADVKGTSHEFHDLGRLDQGRFAWSVKAIRKQGKSTTESRDVAGSFGIKIEKLGKTEILNPDEDYIY